MYFGKMKFTYFKIKNFKGIEELEIKLTLNEEPNIYTLVGLNESGKTTILEAINFFSHKPESLDSLGLENYVVEDIHDLIPIHLRDNFNDHIAIEVGLSLSDADIKKIRKEVLAMHDMVVTSCNTEIKYTQKYHFINSKHDPSKDENIWTFWAKGRKRRGQKIRSLTHSETLFLHGELFLKRIPSILYFPNFLFDFPDKIYLEDEYGDLRDSFYRVVIQDILDALDNNTNIEDHILDRLYSDDRNEKRNLDSLRSKMERKMTEVIFNSWNEIFKKTISNKEIVLTLDLDEDSNAYLSISIKDNIDTYELSERSLGFRWFFIYILLTQFRGERKGFNDAFFLFDEPASNLHPTAQTELLKSFENLPNVIYTTHSQYLINPKWLENTFIVKNGGIDYENEADYVSKNTNVTISKYRKFVNENPSKVSYFQPILNVIEYSPSDLSMVDKAVIVEGKNDYYSLSYYQKVILKNNNPISIIPGMSSGNLESLISLYLGWGKDFIVLLDADGVSGEGDKQKKRYLEMFGDILTDKLYTYEDINSSWTKFRGEDLFSSSDQLKIQKTTDANQTKFHKKIFNRSLQDCLASDRKVALSNATQSNFDLVLSFLRKKL